MPFSPSLGGCKAFVLEASTKSCENHPAATQSKTQEEQELTMDGSGNDLTLLMNRAAEGSRSATDELLPLVYDELRGLAHAKLRHEPGNLTLQATALVHEAYLRLGGSDGERWEHRRHYFAAAAEAMRRILIERARRVAGPKAGSGRVLADIDVVEAAVDCDPTSWLALDEVLAALSSHDAELAEIVSLRFFAGLSIDQIAAATGVSPRTVDNRWKVARAFLLKHMPSPAGESGGA
jgi:RNA polymerase sigma factor (TIGR02999 family)